MGVIPIVSRPDPGKVTQGPGNNEAVEDGVRAAQVKRAWQPPFGESTLSHVSLPELGGTRRDEAGIAHFTYRQKEDADYHQHSLKIVVVQARLSLQLVIGEEEGGVDDGDEGRQPHANERKQP